MKLIELKCKNCGSNLKVNENDENITCIYCNATFKLDDEVQHIEYDNMEQSGYEFEKGRIRAQQESLYMEENPNNYTKKSKSKIFLLILAWLFLFPLTATYFIIKSKKLNKKMKIIAIIILWIIFIIVGIFGNIQEEENLKKKIITCYSEETFNKLDELIGIDNIKSNNSDYITCDNLILNDSNYKKIEINLDNNKQLVSIKIDNNFIYNNEILEEQENSSK